MDESLRMSGGQCLSDLLGRGKCLLQAERPLLEPFSDRRSLNQLHDDRRRAEH